MVAMQQVGVDSPTILRAAHRASCADGGADHHGRTVSQVANAVYAAC